MLTLKPTKSTNQAVIVVPILAPNKTPIDSRKVSKPAFTKLTTITVVTEELCTKAVIPNPARTPFNLLDVMARNHVLNLLPAACCKPSDITFIP